MFGLPDTDAARLPVQMAALGHYALRSFMASPCSYLSYLHRLRHIRSICVGACIAYDETPLTFAAPDVQGKRAFLESALEVAGRDPGCQKKKGVEWNRSSATYCNQISKYRSFSKATEVAAYSTWQCLARARRSKQTA